MRVLDVISACDNLKPNEYSQNKKREWVNKIESDIRRYATMYSGKKADMGFKNEINPELYLGDEFSDVYVYYLISMIDLSNQEYMLYNNSAQFFNSALSNWKKHHRRENIPVCSVSLKY